VKALILAAGEGQRLRPFTESCPKPLLPLGDASLIEHSVSLLRRHGVEEIAVNLHHLPDAIPARLGPEITYSYEERLLGSAGAAKRLAGFLDERFFVIYGDVLTDADLTALAERHAESGAVVTLLLFEADDPSRCGIVELDEDDRIVRFVEKPRPGEAEGNLANAGVYVLEPRALEILEDGATADFGRDVFPRLLERGEHLCGVQSGAYVLDIGSQERYAQAQLDVASGRFTPAWAVEAAC
jgi:NDP-sugar pyrophosphorylase family protein